MLEMIIKSSEHSEINYNFAHKQIIEFNRLFNQDVPNPKYLGIHQEFDQNELKLKSYYYVGYRWISETEDKYIYVSPKEYKKSKADYLKMLLECMQDSIVSKKLTDTYEIFFNEKWIEINDEQDEITPLLILHFLNIIKNITRKGLKKGYMKITENLSSKIKGKILIYDTIRQNHTKNRIDKTICCHQVFTINCIENQIIKTALLQCSRNLFGVNNKDISKLLKQNLNFFELVDKKEVFESDFSEIKHSPFFKEYKDALNLARMIFKRFGFSLNSSSLKYKHQIPPFYINMPELFERYVEVLLRKYHPDLIDGNRDIKFEMNMRPDFLLPSKCMIIDAKYKYWYDSTHENDKFKDDYQQLSLYGRANKIRNKIQINKENEPILVFIYPEINGRNEIKLDKTILEKEFNKIYRVGINIPLLNN